MTGGTGTVWEAGRFDAGKGPRKILFGRMHEDAAIEERAFERRGRIFCIASAGCTAMRLAARHEVTAVDINPVQLAYAQARAAGAPMRIGSAERIIGVGRRLMALFGWRRRVLDAFLDLNRPEEQWEFWHRHLDTTGFRVSTDALFSPTCLRLAYAGPLVDSVPRGFGRVIRSRLERCWKTHSNRDNPYARDLLLGDLPAAPTRASGPIRFQCADAASFLESCPPGSFDGFTLSNVVDGASETYCRRLFAAVRRAATPDAVVVSRSIGEPRQETATNLAAQDRSVLWGVVEVRSVAGL